MEMTKQEFQELTRREITKEDYRMVEKLYMAAGDMDKAEFCREIKAMCAYDAANDQIELRRCLREIAVTVDKLTARINHMENAGGKKRQELAEFLLSKAGAYDDRDLYNEAERLVGRKSVVLLKLRAGQPLSADDMDYICNNLA